MVPHHSRQKIHIFEVLMLFLLPGGSDCIRSLIETQPCRYRQSVRPGVPAALKIICDLNVPRQPSSLLVGNCLSNVWTSSGRPGSIPAGRWSASLGHRRWCARASGTPASDGRGACRTPSGRGAIGEFRIDVTTSRKVEKFVPDRPTHAVTGPCRPTGATWARYTARTSGIVRRG